jgi:LacI family transcriptional regulator, galactose operon repressor
LHVKRPTSDDVAALAGVSRTTVSFVLNDRPGTNISPATRARVLAAAAQLGYQPNASARGLAGGRSQTIGLVLRQTPEQVAEDALLAETLRGLSAAARLARYRVLVEPYHVGNGSYGDLIRSHGADGLVVSGPREDDEELRGLVRDQAPVILQGSLAGLPVPSVDIDNLEAARVAVRHLVELGHRTIGCVTNAPLVYTAACERVAGYRAALADAGIPFDQALVVEAEFDATSGHAAIQRLLSRADMTAVFVASDIVAVGVLTALREAGKRIPEDVAVVGFDDIPLAAHLDPPLTTVRLPAYELGRAAGSALLDRIAGRPVQDRTILPTELLVRSSTAPPRSSGGGARAGP